MCSDLIIAELGETELISIIEKLVYKKTGKKLIQDDSFYFFNLHEHLKHINSDTTIAFNSDMFVSSTDAPTQMSSFQMGRKSILMNLSDLIVKGLRPLGAMVSLGVPKQLKVEEFKMIIEGIVEYSMKYNLEYIGGDLNETNEIIINPTVFGISEKAKIIHRTGLKKGDYLVANGKFGLTGVGFDILLDPLKNLTEFSPYHRSIESVLSPGDLGEEAFYLSDNNLATSSIDSSDGIAKSLHDLMIANSHLGVGFEVDFNANLIDKEAIEYSKKFNKSLEDLIFNGGEEFIHLFTIDPKNYDAAQRTIFSNNGQIYKIGTVVSTPKIYYVRNKKKHELDNLGFEHFKDAM
ncbi:MAG: hypothetical protein GF383_15340 [Candidatus Lokiarchaeota archaeon]|nr:hypothetical protein [Candidatus Lokiarchaeota archaeon]MBD3342916.1 hypothetical protein [Candidatus Lokiarchaeota archaeon]